MSIDIISYPVYTDLSIEIVRSVGTEVNGTLSNGTTVKLKLFVSVAEP